MMESVWIVGQLATHSRGDVLTEAIGATPSEARPDACGLCMAFGSEFQDLPDDQKGDWATWTTPAGRTLLLLPPFRIQETDVPATWRAYRQDAIEIGDVRGLPKLLRSEVRYGLAGSLQTPSHMGGSWKDGVINTACYKKHPHSGAFALTALPVWSLTVLDHRKVLTEWLQELHGLAGEPSDVDQEAETETFEPNKDHFALMLHLCEWEFDSSDAALQVLEDSPVFAIPHKAAQQRLGELDAAGLATDGRLTDAGCQVLMSSPYAAYAEAMEAKRK